MKSISKFFLSFSLLIIVSNTWAESVTLANPSFEDDVKADGGFTPYNATSGWGFYNAGYAGTWNPAVGQNAPTNDCPADPIQAFIDGIPDGDQVGWSNGPAMYQNTGVQITPEHTYVLSVWVGGRCVTFSGKSYAVQLTAGATLISGETGYNPTNSWERVEVTYESPPGDPNAGQDLYIRLLNNSGQVQINWDDVQLTDSLSAETFSCSGFYEPFDAPMTVNKKVKRALPLKFNLYDELGDEITGDDLENPPIVEVRFSDDTTGSGIEGYEGELLPNGLSDDGNEFRYDPDSMQWILNLGLKAYTASGAYTITAVAGDSSYTIDGCSEMFTRLP